MRQFKDFFMINHFLIRLVNRLFKASKPILLIGSVFLVLIVIGLVNRFGLLHAAPRAKVAPPSSVLVAPAKEENPEQEIVLPGTLQPLRETTIYAQSTGYVTNWLVDIGAQVKEGDLLAIVDSPDVDQQLAHAKATLAAAKANLQIATTTYNRYFQLLDKQYVSKQLVDEQLATKLAREAEVSADQADVKRLEELQAFERVRAPFSGIITYRNVEKGQLVSPATTNSNGWLFKLSATDPLRLFITVPQNQASFIHDGSDVKIALPEAPNKSFMGKIVRNAGALDESSKTLLTEIQVPNSNHQLPTGGYVEAHIQVHIDHPALLVSSSSLIVNARGQQLAVVDKSQHIHLVPVKIGNDFGTQLEIVSGIHQGDLVVQNPSDSVFDGASVLPIMVKNNH
jgi:RND family efflux transporter MFP subunit